MFWGPETYGKECPARQVRRRLLHPHNQLLGATYHGLARVLADLERWVAAAAAFGRSVESMEATFPPNDLLVAQQHRQHAELLDKAVEPAAALRLRHRWARVLELHYGDPMMEYEEGMRLSDAVPTLDQLT